MINANTNISVFRGLIDRVIKLVRTHYVIASLFFYFAPSVSLVGVALHHYNNKIEILEDKVKIAEAMSYPKAIKALEDQEKLFDKLLELKLSKSNNYASELEATLLRLQEEIRANIENTIEENNKRQREQELLLALNTEINEEYRRLDGSLAAENVIRQIYQIDRKKSLLMTNNNQDGCLTAYIESENDTSVNIPLPCLIAGQAVEDASSNALRTICLWLNDVGKKCESVEQLSTLGIRIRTL